MDSSAALNLSAELSKINFLLENLWAMILQQHGATPEEVSGLADEACRQFETLAGTRHGGDFAEGEAAVVREIGGQRLAMFFAGVQARLLSIPPKS